MGTNTPTPPPLQTVDDQGATTEAIETATTPTATPDELEKQHALKPKERTTYFHVDDLFMQHDLIQDGLQDNWGMSPDQRLGTAESAADAISQIRKLAEENNAPDFIILDQDFFINDDDRDAGRRTSINASREFVTKFAELAADPELAPALSKTKIIMVSGSDDDAYLREMQAISPAVIGRAPKGNIKKTINRLTAALADNGVIRKDDMVREAKKTFIPEALIKKMAAEIGYSELLELDSEDPTSNIALKILGMIAEARKQADLEPLETDDPAFVKILKLIEREDDISYVSIPAKLLFAKRKMEE
ncbi:hypothetical protein KJ742_06355 [Patescibacteria group bacterium]|nr:hypothetical protein [Patescibacteria group bacterium]MBU1683533.1 hypothetical protein [Patescibacteria group bacterium]MBU1935015.1 hypothetical protein [Patescibacteria group bacterium]